MIKALYVGNLIPVGFTISVPHADLGHIPQASNELRVSYSFLVYQVQVCCLLGEKRTSLDCTQ